jgi:hypothetical protein
MNPIPFPGRLDLTENLMLLMHPGGMAIADQRAPHECAEAPHWVWTLPGDAAPLAVYLVIEARLQDGEDVWHAPHAVTPEIPHEAYGNRVMQAKVQYPGGLAEDWTLRVDPLQVGFDWIRQPHVLGGRSAFRACTPTAGNALQFWRMLEGDQTPPLWDGRPKSSGGGVLWEGQSSSALLYSALPRASMRLDVAASGALRIEAVPSPARQEEPVWQLDWTISHGQLMHMSGNLGLRAASRSFHVLTRSGMADASIDFDTYYEQVLLGGVAMVLQETGEVRQACLSTDAPEAPAPLEEIVLACESLGLCAPTLTAELLQRQLGKVLAGEQNSSESNDLGLPAAASPALPLLMAGRHLRLTGELDLVQRHQEPLRAAAEQLLALRRPGEALPVFLTADLHHQHIKHPAGTAVVYAGLSRWAAIEERLGNVSDSQRFAEAALAMQWAAIAPVEAGGLWHLGRGSFVSYLPVENPGHRLNAPPTNQERGAEFDFGQQVLAFWLGLCPDEELIRRSMEWVDYSYTYASGRGGPSYPPGYRRAFHALLDIAVRMRYGCGEVAPLLQRALDNGARAGLPFSRDVRGRALPAGSLLDNSPYFEIVLRRHYGLDYDAGGWRMANPRPIGNYPLTRVTSLRHRNAIYAITWQGRGTIQRVTLNGAPHTSRVLDKTSGEHEVLVTLA